MNLTTSQKIVLLTAGISMSLASMAWAEPPEPKIPKEPGLFQQHTDGSIWWFTGTPCADGVCPGWQEWDNNPNTLMIAGARAEGNTLFESHRDGSVWEFVGPACSGGVCPGWVQIDNNPNGGIIGVGGLFLYESFPDGTVWEFTGAPCSNGSCPGWRRLPTSPNPVSFGATVPINGFGGLFEFDANGSLWQNWTGSTQTITQIDNNPSTVPLFAAGRAGMFQQHQDGSIWLYTQPPCNSEGICAGWVEMDNNPETYTITAGGMLYQQHKDGSIWESTGAACSANVCPGWTEIDHDPDVSFGITAGAVTVYKRHADGSIWQYTGKPCQGRVCRGWRELDNNANTAFIVADGATFFKPF